MRPSIRSASLICAAAAVAVPAALFGLHAWSFERWAATQGGGVCGMPVLAAFVLSVALAWVLSAVSVGLGWVAFVRAPAPRAGRATAAFVGVALLFAVCSAASVALVVA